MSILRNALSLVLLVAASLLSLVPTAGAQVSATLPPTNQTAAPTGARANAQAAADAVPVDQPPAVPPADRLTLRQALQIGLKDNPQTLASRYSVLSARENYNSQRSPINPTIQYAALNNTVAPLSITNGFAQAHNYSAYVTLETNGAQHYRATQAREQFHQAEADAATAVLALRLNIINSYVGVQAANRALEIEQQVYEAARQVSDLTEKRFEIGAGTQADAARAHIAMVQEEQNLITDVANVNTARAALNAALGHLEDAPIDAADTLAYVPAQTPEVARLTEIAEKNRSEIQSAEANLRALKAVPGLERAAYYPDVVFGRDFSSDGEVNVGIAVPIDLGSIRGAVRKAYADVKAQEAEAQLARQNVDLDVKNAYINLMAARKQVDSYETGILKQSETLVSQIKQAYLLGANTILDVITAEDTYRSVQTAYYSAVGTYTQALYTLEHAIGARQDAPPGATLAAANALGTKRP